jgi:beta-glucosidase
MKIQKNLVLVIIILVAIGAIVLVRDREPIEPKPEDDQISEIISQMTLQDKIGQMVLIDKKAITLDDVRRKSIGGVLSGGGGNPEDNTPEQWYEMVKEFQMAALDSKLKIPIFYGVDAVHGNGNLKGAVIFPHNIGLGATGDSLLVKQTAVATAKEVRATGANWNFAPVLSMPEDYRWGRVYECFSSDQNIVAELGTSYIQGLQEENVLATPKHFIGEGQEDWETSKDYKLDQGNLSMSINELKKKNLLPFQEAVAAGAMSIMVSRDSLNGEKISGNKYLLTDLLKNELGFKGFLVSDWGAVDQISDDYYRDIITSINAGMDMVMLPGEYDVFMNNITSAVNNDKISIARIDDAVSRILRAKKSIGLFEQPIPSKDLIKSVGSKEHREIARQAVRQSLVLLKNDNQALPLTEPKNILIVGRAADDIGMQAGGWTIEWQGDHGDTTPGASILDAFKKEFTNSVITYDPMAEKKLTPKAEVGIVVVGEQPYAEGVGDRERLTLSPEDLKRITSVKQNSDKVILIILAGRPLIIQDVLNDIDAVVMAWLPGTEGNGITDVLSGKNNFTGKLPMVWPKTMDQIETKNMKDPLFGFGFGLQY